MRTVKRLTVLVLVMAVLGTVGYAFREEIGQKIHSILPGKALGENRIDVEALPWNLMLVNSQYPMKENYDIALTELRDDQRVDSRMYPYLQEMFDACRADGLYPLVWSSYRPKEEQERILNDKIQTFEEQGYAEESAREEALRWAAEPGYSEHQTGLAVDINSEDEAFSASPDVYAWLKEHCAEYGFILRYPEEKEAITGTAYEAWHFRYVGKDAAKEIMERGICLEEYLAEKYPR